MEIKNRAKSKSLMKEHECAFLALLKQEQGYILGGKQESFR